MGQKIRDMNFMEAVEWMAQGGAVRRKGWPLWVRYMAKDMENTNIKLRFSGLRAMLPHQLGWKLDILDVQTKDWYIY